MLDFHRKFSSSITPARPVKGKAQEEEKKLRRTEKEEAAHMAKPQEV